MPLSYDAAPEWENATALEEPPLGIYLHFPWCLQKCPYCDFLSIPAAREVIPHAAYADAVINELSARAPWAGNRPVHSIFVGGGTPSLWQPQQLGRVLTAIRQHFELSEQIEITVECNPSSFDRSVAEALLGLGVNRVSIGVQGLDNQRLQFLGRLHDARGALAAVNDALRAGVPRVSADLIFGVHGQSVDQAVEEARTLAELGITHLSAYSLTIEAGTAFGALHKKGRLPLLDEDTAARMFLALDDQLSPLGFDHYEISNYAKAGHYSRHNLGYWLGWDYLGIGCGAWGTITENGMGLRYRNTQSADRYITASRDWPQTDLRASAKSKGEAVGLIDQTEILDAETRLRERILLGLRLHGGLDLEQAAQRATAEAWTPARRQAVQKLTSRGRLAQEGNRIWVPKEAWLFADATISELL
ncbi:MAG TPA: radical SAM family heme chaperone HemW [Polyangiaceae bacterium]|jgi:oxygen-independent coproporphyrinogen-3 oxidase|nr:radical SAM family heme chaperone HemW [Polyangiaceae bacterium]